MNTSFAPVTVFDAVIVESDVQFTLADLCRAARAERTLVLALVDEGVVQPLNADEAPRDEPDSWRFDGHALARTRSAWRLTAELQIGIEAVALVVDLLDEIETLKRRLQRAGAG